MFNILNYMLDKKLSDISWVDKYRPNKLSDVVYQDEIVKMLSTAIKTNTLPHTLFYGPPGTGKTSVILAVCKELFGPKKFRERVMELNASDERGIGVVRNKILSFAKSALSLPDKNYPSPPYKIIILDEADAMTSEAQSALRKVIEDYSYTTRFCFICNYVNQIIQPIISRCAIFRFKQLDNTIMTRYLENISKKENIEITSDVIKKVAELSFGDLRKAIMLLQNTRYIKKNNIITIDDIIDITNDTPQSILNTIDLLCLQKKGSFDDIVNLTKNINMLGYAINNLLWNVNKLVIYSDHIDEIQKSKICLHNALTEKRLMDGSDEYIQLLHTLVFIRNI